MVRSTAHADSSPKVRAQNDSATVRCQMVTDLNVVGAKAHADSSPKVRDQNDSATLGSQKVT